MFYNGILMETIGISVTVSIGLLLFFFFCFFIAFWDCKGGWERKKAPTPPPPPTHTHIHIEYIDLVQLGCLVTIKLS